MTHRAISIAMVAGCMLASLASASADEPKHGGILRIYKLQA